MNFDLFKAKVSNLKKMTLPGPVAHDKLAPEIRKKYLEDIDMETPTARDSAVLALFFPDLENETHLLFILRKSYKGVHSNQVGFPGGKVEKEDENLMQTALRETHEEVGIAPGDIEVIKSLTKLYIPPSDFWVYPFIGILDATPTLIPHEKEVEQVLEVNIEDFLNSKNLISKKISTSYAEELVTPAFLLNEKIVWGATAMILSEIKELLAKVL